ncbi:MAG: nitroreductase family protein [Deltaproteobacteria bacterium]|nr:nitroreductase family protein [Deltaproteobacteria bacterium]MBW2419141.1 nitroreductase family protein [Deltaproteobacteria bacterium]
MLLDLSPEALLTTTRTVRKRLDFERPVERETLEACLETALQAPNGSNMQLWRWVVVDDRARVAELAAIYAEAIRDYAAQVEGTGFYAAGGPPGMDRITESVMHLAENLHRAPALVVPCIAGRLEKCDVFMQASLWGSILPAAWSLMLALRLHGLGSAWTTVHLNREQEAAELLGIPYDDYTQAGLFPVAYTIGSEFRPAPRQPLSKVLHWNRWA